eukprot:4200489-Prymnesium_polylepis.1
MAMRGPPRHRLPPARPQLARPQLGRAQRVRRLLPQLGRRSKPERTARALRARADRRPVSAGGLDGSSVPEAPPCVQRHCR